MKYLHLTMQAICSLHDRYQGTEGLYELKFKRQDLFTDDKLHTYTELLFKSNADKKDYHNSFHSQHLRKDTTTLSRSDHVISHIGTILTNCDLEEIEYSEYNSYIASTSTIVQCLSPHRTIA